MPATVGLKPAPDNGVIQLVEWKKTCPSATSTSEVRRIIEAEAEVFGNF
jgi:hypothetical protein